MLHCVLCIVALDSGNSPLSRPLFIFDKGPPEGEGGGGGLVWGGFAPNLFVFSFSFSFFFLFLAKVLSWYVPEAR